MDYDEDCYIDNYDEEYSDNMNMDGFGGPPPIQPLFNNRKSMNFQRNYQYNNAYGNYRGGYGPPGGFGNWRGPPQNYGPPDGFGPPPFYAGPPEPPPPPGGFVWGRGFGPGGPPVKKQPFEEKTIRYLLKCGVTKENVKNLPKDLLRLYEPEYCGLCAHGFDTYAVSRMHYISKNHMKNQKKWLSQQNEMGSRRNKEVPLKSRDLYCELCDVHITSKNHSDSHYAGKPHRAIVDGRKNPRNPFLLQRGMESRVEQLIRREKKFMKGPEEGEESADAAAPVAKVVPSSSELYCDICKTSVTCTEQMTMHLNGKRHLSKEKHHILKMMTGEKDNKEKEEEVAEAVAEDATGEEENDGEEQPDTVAADAENADDWANGSGNWDEPAK